MYRQVPSTDCSFIVNYIDVSPNPPGIIFTPNKEALMARQTPPHSPWDCSAHLHRTSSSASATENNTFKMKWMHPVQSPNNNHLIPNYYTWGLIIITSDKENCKLKLCCLFRLRLRIILFSCIKINTRAIATGPVSPVSSGPLFPHSWLAWRCQLAPLLGGRPRNVPKHIGMLKLAR